MRGEAIFAVSLFGCAGVGACGLGEAHEPGENLGMFDVVATMSESTCGAGALNAPAVWEFEVKLVRDGSALYWVNGTRYIPGEFASDGVTFTFSASTQVTVLEPTIQRPGCVITRLDSALGVLTVGTPDIEGAGATPNSFTATLSYGYLADQDGDCTEAVGVEGGFSTLPCQITYDLVAKVPESEE